MGGYINGANISDIYHGNDCIESVYKGSDLIFDNSDILKKYLQGSSTFVIPKETTKLNIYCFLSWDNVKKIVFEEPCQITTLWAGTFQECTSLQTMSIPNSVTKMYGAQFWSCDSLKEVIFQEPCQITEFGERFFAGCISLPSIDIPSSVVALGYLCFDECLSLTEITIPSSIETIDSTGFRNCSNLHTIYVDKPTDSISGAPWGATNATVIWNDNSNHPEKPDPY